MKKMVYLLIVLTLCTALLALYLRIAKKEGNSEKNVAPPSDNTAATHQANSSKSSVPPANPSVNRPAQTSSAVHTPTQSPIANPVEQAVETLVSPQSTFDQKQAAWDQFNSTNTLDRALAILAERTQSDPSLPEPFAALGMGYLRKCGMIKDVREMGILAMNADKAFEQALELDPKNWEARFTRAVAMSFWPPELNKGPEVLENFRTLIEQQETQVPQPHFAMTYVKLGEEYNKLGYSDFAQQVFSRGASLYPQNTELRSKVKAE